MDVKISNPDKILFPFGIKKIDLIKYYENISGLILPHLKNRLLMLERYPNGIKENKFYQKNIPGYVPKWIPRKKVKSEKFITNYVICNNKETLIYLANLATISFHIWLSREDKLRIPDKLIFDLDPSIKRKNLLNETTEGFRFILEKIGLNVFLMVTGSRGLHLVIPIKREMDFKEVREFAGEIADFVCSKDPENLTTEQRKEKRGNRIFIDTYRNGFTQTAICPYSARAIDKAPIAAPIEWDELRNYNSQKYNINNIFKRKKEPWKNFFKKENQKSVMKARKIFKRII